MEDMKNKLNQNIEKSPEKEYCDPLAAGDMYGISKMPSYEKMRDEAIAQYKNNRRANRIFLLIGLVVLVPSAIYFYQALMSKDISLIFSGLLTFLSAWWTRSCFRKIPELKRAYRYRLQRAVETMSNVNVFMRIPEEDLKRFDRFWQ